MNKIMTLKKINSLSPRIMFGAILLDILTFISFLQGKVIHSDGETEKIVWLWFCAICAGGSLLLNGIWIGLQIAKYYISLYDSRDLNTLHNRSED